MSQYVHKTITKHLMHTSNDVFERSTAAFLKSYPVNCLLVNWIQKTPLLSTQLKSRSQTIRNHGVTSNWLSQGEQAFTLRSMTKMYCFGFWEHRELSVLQKKVSLDRNEITGLFSDSCFVIVIAPMADLLKGAEIIIVPDFRKNQVLFAALTDEGGKKPTEPFRIRLIPSLTTLKSIQESPPGYHRQTGTLIIVDPEAGGVLYNSRRKIIPPLSPCTRREADLVGRLLGVTPLIGDRAKKQAVRQTIGSVSLIHIAAHGNAERGESIFSSNIPPNFTPQEILSLGDVWHLKNSAARETGGI